MIPGQDPRLLRRGALDRGDHHQPVILDGDLDAETAELPPRIHLDFFIDIRRHEGRMGVKGVQHPPDGPVDKLLGFRLLNVISLNL